MNLHLRTEPITEDDATVAAALAEASTSALVASAALLSGDMSLVRGPIRPRRFVQDEFHGQLSLEEQGALRRAAHAAIRSWQAAGCPPSPPMAIAELREIMDWVACEHVDDDYAALYLEELDLAGENPRAFGFTADEAHAARWSVIIIGCGEAGLLAAIRLTEAGIPFRIIEKNDDAGGTWYENTYPGCRVDVASHFYSYSFGPNQDFSSYYTLQPELHEHFRALFDHFDIGPHVDWKSEVTRAVWDDDAAMWQLTVRRADGSTDLVTAPVVISGVGVLNRPLVPDLPGLERFEGPAFHSARWDHSVDLRGKRVALIGAGASGFQIGPAICDEVEHLTVFQRTPQWMAPNPRYHATVKPGEHWVMTHIPGYSRWYRFMIMFQSTDKLLGMVKVDETWADFPKSANAMSAKRRDLFERWILQQVGDDTELAAKVIPDYPPMSKRMLQDDGSWLRCLRRPDVELVTDTITSIDEHSVTAGGRTYEIDVIVLATGFRASEVLFPMEIVGRGGRTIAEFWDGKPCAYRGTMVPGFPNFFILNGPGTGLAHAGSVIQTTESQMRYVGDALRTLVHQGHRTIEPTMDAYDEYNHELHEELSTMMWGHPHIRHSWYKAADGKVYVLSPWRNVDFWKMTGHVEEEHHVIR